MTIETQTSTTPDSGGNPDGLTSAELAYLSSGGQDSAALEQEWSGDGQSDGVAGDQRQQAPQDGQQQKAASGDPQGQDDGEAVDGEIVIDSQGRAKDKTTGRFVPHQAYHAVREKYKATRDELAGAKETITKFNERLAVLSEVYGQQQQPQQQAEADEQAPDPEKDIFAFVKWQAKQIDKLSNQLTEKTSRYDARDAETQLRSAYVNDATQFMAKSPDFRDAYSHLVQGRDAELAAIGMADPAERRAFIAKEETALVQQAMQKKMSPSQVLYNLAKARGYAGPAPAKNAAPDPMQKIQQIANGQKAAGNNLSNAGGTGGEGLTVEAFLSMNEDEYSRAMEKLSPSQRKALLGG